MTPNFTVHFSHILSTKPCVIFLKSEPSSFVPRSAFVLLLRARQIKPFVFLFFYLLCVLVVYAVDHVEEEPEGEQCYEQEPEGQCPEQEFPEGFENDKFNLTL